MSRTPTWRSNESRRGDQEADDRAVAMRVVIDPSLCQGHLLCVGYAPDVFEADDRGESHVSVAIVPADSEDAVRTAVTACPEQAIRIEVEQEEQ